MSRMERSVTCVHCQKAHDRGFIWNFSDTLRVCFTCYRVMGEDGRKGYERKAAREKPKKAEVPTTGLQPAGAKGMSYATKVVCLLALLIAILGAGACYLYKPLTGEGAEQHLWARESHLHRHLNR